MITVESLTSELGLDLAAGQKAKGNPIRWVHISEIEDPIPWLSGGELLLTTGIQLSDAKRQREFVRLLSEHGLAGLGLGTGFDHPKLPKALVSEARKRDFPLFEVPYEMPFIAITEAAFTRLVNEQYDVLQRGIDVHKRLERLLLEERGLAEVVKALSTAIEGTTLVLDPRGSAIASQTFRRALPDEAMDAIRSQVAERSATQPGLFFPAAAELADRAIAYPVAAPGGGAPQAWLVAVRDAGGLGDFERLIVQQAAVVVALELMRERIARETERRLSGDLLAAAVSGRLEPEELRGRLAPFGIGPEAAVLVFALEDPRGAEGSLERHLAGTGCPALVAAHGASGRELLCAVVDANGNDPVEVATRAREALAAERPQVRAAASRRVPVDALRRAWHEARCALEATAFSNGAEPPPVASHQDLGAFTLLLGLNDEDALRVYCDSVLEPIEKADASYGGELMRSLAAFIEQNGQWERAARELYCHRHTLRYRIRRIEELSGRDLSRAQDRIELWLAMRARELTS